MKKAALTDTVRALLTSENGSGGMRIHGWGWTSPAKRQGPRMAEKDQHRSVDRQQALVQSKANLGLDCGLPNRSRHHACSSTLISTPSQPHIFRRAALTYSYPQYIPPLQRACAVPDRLDFQSQSTTTSSTTRHHHASVRRNKDGAAEARASVSGIAGG